METDKLAELYDHYNKLDTSKDKITEFEPSYLSILSSVHGSAQEKQLCSQFISKFFIHFPNHYDTAIDALLDLCEDDDANIRRRAIKELPNICRDRKEFVTKIADVLAQLLLSEDQIELTIVNQALTTLANYDIKSFFLALFGQILEGEEETRDRVIKFLRDRFRLINTNLLTKEVEEFFLEESKKVLVDVTKEEFLILMNILSGLKISKTLNGHNTLLAIIKEQAELNNDFNPADTEFLDKLLMCIRHGSPYFSQFSPSTDFVLYLCFKVLPNCNLLEVQQSGIELEVLQALAEIVTFVSPNTENDQIEKCQEIVFNQLLNYIPRPPEDLSVELSDISDDLPGTQFSHIECLLYTFHQLCKFNPNYFSDSKAEIFKDFKLRLQYLARGVQSYVNKLKKVIVSLKPEELKTPDNKIKVVAFKATTNINSLIKDFFKLVPSFKTTIQLSFKQSSKSPLASTKSIGTPATTATDVSDVNKTEDKLTSENSSGTKRQPITAPEGAPEPKRERKFYAPPAGKFSRGGGGGGFRNFGNNSNRGQTRNRFTPKRGRGFRRY